MSVDKVKLFLSHASEDKDDFVRPLAEALRLDFEVWYDEYSLLVGPSLLSQISKGLQQCQYGIVVLSQHFFDKKWPKAELDGLFNLEPVDQSLILPIWHKVTKEEVSGFSPILAARNATRSELGVPRVVSDLKRSIEAGERTKQINNPLGRKIKAFQDTAGAQEKYKQWAWSIEGIEGTWNEWNRIEEIAMRILAQHDETRFQVSQNALPGNWSGYVAVKGPAFSIDVTKIDGTRIPALRFDIQEMAMNSIFSARCWRRVFLEHAGIFATYGQPEIIDELEFKPYCTKDGKAVWQMQDQSVIDTQTLVQNGLSLLFDLAHKGMRGEL